MYSSPVAIHVRITRYSRWYAELARDAYVQGYNERFAPFSTHNASLSPTDLLMEVATSADTFLAFVQLDTEGLVCVFHRIRCIETFLGGTPKMHLSVLILQKELLPGQQSFDVLNRYF
jgi:hypothetical protein